MDAAAASLPPNRLRRALASVDDAALRSGLANEFVGTGAMAAIVQHELQREEERRRVARQGRGALLPASAGAARLAAEPSLERPLASAAPARRRARRAAAASDTSSSTSSSSGDAEEAEDDEEEDDGAETDDGSDTDDDDEEDEEEEEQSLGEWLATGSGALWLADQLGECLETSGVGSLDDALRLQFRRLRRKAAAAFASAGAGGPFAPPPPKAATGGEGAAAATTASADGDTGLLARLKKRVRAKLLPAPVAGALAAVGVTPEEYFATGQPLPLPFLVEKFIQRRCKVWISRNLRNVFLIGGAAACASTLVVSSVKAVALGVARAAPAVPLPRPRAVWTRAGGFLARRVFRRGEGGGATAAAPSSSSSSPPLPLFYRYEAGDALGALVDGAIAPGFLGPWIVIYVALRLIVGPDDRVPAAAKVVAAPSAGADKKKSKKKKRRQRRRRRAGGAAAEEAAAAAADPAAAAAAAPASPADAAAASARPGSRAGRTDDGNSSEYGWV